LTYKILAIFL